METIYEGLHAQTVVTDVDFPAWLDQSNASLKALDVGDDIEDELKVEDDTPDGIHS